jgi:hypothetical protein
MCILQFGCCFVFQFLPTLNHKKCFVLLRTCICYLFVVYITVHNSNRATNINYLALSTSLCQSRFNLLRHTQHAPVRYIILVNMYIFSILERPRIGEQSKHSGLLTYMATGRIKMLLIDWV